MKRKNNIITTLALICAIMIMALLPLPVAEAASFTVSKSNVSIENGKSSTITINAPTHTGRLDIVSSNPSVVSIDASNLWVENNSKTITIFGESAGTATITITGELYDSSIEEEAVYTRTINVTINKSASSNSTNNSGSNSGTQNGGSQSGNTSGETSNNNQSTNTGSSSVSKPSAGGTSNFSSSTSANSKPSSSPSNSSSSKPVQSTSSANTSSSEESTTVETSNEEEIKNEIEDVVQEEAISEEVSKEEMEESVIQIQSQEGQSNNVEEVKEFNSKWKIIIAVVIGAIALSMILIGIGISKNIFKK